MDNLYRFFYNPFSFTIDVDRRRRSETKYYGKYEPTRLKRFMIWIFNDRIKPVDWEEVPPFIEPDEEAAYLQTPRRATPHPYECLTQPNMLTQENILFRRILLLGLYFCCYKYVERKRYIYNEYYLFREYYFKNSIIKLFAWGWIYYLTCKSFFSKDYQLPYN